MTIPGMDDHPESQVSKILMLISRQLIDASKRPMEYIRRMLSYMASQLVVALLLIWQPVCLDCELLFYTAPFCLVCVSCIQ
ncbi:hypothetical protein QJS04_geneDACA023930 [Acorus gramineus]|uniref:Uncharacterized protein n=1 Tax=Acorus gramineus TaxID=55184 RepID=A0AAV9B9V0_ACOGR|nr:hypothetical protein QJS04_geneDACA023930 [Acorus gramineus]